MPPTRPQLLLRALGVGVAHHLSLQVVEKVGDALAGHCHETLGLFSLIRSHARQRIAGQSGHRLKGRLAVHVQPHGGNRRRLWPQQLRHALMHTRSPLSVKTVLLRDFRGRCVFDLVAGGFVWRFEKDVVRAARWKTSAQLGAIVDQAEQPHQVVEIRPDPAHQRRNLILGQRRCRRRRDSVAEYVSQEGKPSGQERRRRPAAPCRRQRCGRPETRTRPERCCNRRASRDTLPPRRGRYRGGASTMASTGGPPFSSYTRNRRRQRVELCASTSWCRRS